MLFDQPLNMHDLMSSLTVMWQGMAGIFLVLVVIALIVTLLAKLTNKKPKDDKEDK